MADWEMSDFESMTAITWTLASLYPGHVIAGTKDSTLRHVVSLQIVYFRGGELMWSRKTGGDHIDPGQLSIYRVEVAKGSILEIPL